VQIQGAVIDGDLDLEGCTLDCDLSLVDCQLNGSIMLRRASARTIQLDGSHCRDIEADGLEVSGDVWLRKGFTAAGIVRLLGAKITGDLDCSGGRFQARDESALLCDGIKVDGAVFLRNDFVAAGLVRLPGAQIGQSLECDNGRFEGCHDDGHALLCSLAKISGDVYMRGAFFTCGTVNLVGALVGRDVACNGGTFGAALVKNVDAVDPQNVEPKDIALRLSRATIVGTLWLNYRTGSATFHGGTDLSGAKIGRIVDSVTKDTKIRKPNPLPAGAGASPAFLQLDGLTYDRFGDPTDVSARGRIAFLDLQEPNDLGKAFKPQPWEQVIKVLRDMGHYNEARNVAIEKQERLREAGRISGPPIWHILYGRLSAYGYRPSYLILWALVISAVCAALFAVGARYGGVMMPTDRRILDEVKDPACRPELGGNWTTCPALVGRYPAFHSIAYSIDQILPVISTQQSKDWAIATEQPCSSVNCFGLCTSPWKPGTPNMRAAYSLAGLGIWILARAENLIGWIFGLMFIATVSGLIKRD